MDPFPNDFAFLSKITNLKKLSLYWHDIVTATCLSFPTCPILKYLDIDTSQEMDMESIAINCPALIFLRIFNSDKVKKFGCVTKLRMLLTLEIGHFPITTDDLTAISSLPKLKKLELLECGITNIACLA